MHGLTFDPLPRSLSLSDGISRVRYLCVLSFHLTLPLWPQITRGNLPVVIIDRYMQGPFTTLLLLLRFVCVFAKLRLFLTLSIHRFLVSGRASFPYSPLKHIGIPTAFVPSDAPDSPRYRFAFFALRTYVTCVVPLVPLLSLPPFSPD